MGIFKKIKGVVFFCLFFFLFLNILNKPFAEERINLALTHFILAKIYDSWDEPEMAFLNYQQALKLDPENHIIRLNLGITYIKRNAIDKAIEQLKQAYNLAPEAVEAPALLAIVYTARNELELANQYYEVALKNATKLQPKNIELYHDLAKFYLQQKRFKEAEEIYKIILLISPDDAKAHFYLAHIYDELKQRDLAIKELKEAIRLNSNYADALNYLGYLYVEEEVYLNEAEALIKKALEIEPQNPAYIDSLGWLYFKQGKVKEAKEFLEKAVSLLEDPVIYDHLGEVYFKLKEPKRAKESWQKALELDPKQEKIKEKLEKVFLDE